MVQIVGGGAGEVAAAAAAEDRNAAAGRGVQCFRQPLHALHGPVGAVDVEHEARGVGTVADDPQPAPEQQQALVGGEAPGSTITARPSPRGTGSAVARQRASVLRMNFATATPESAPVSEISASHSYSRGDGRVSLKLHPAVVCPPLRKSAEKLTRSPLLTIS